MIKFVIQITKAIVTIALILLFSSCKETFEGIKGDGNVKTEKRQITEPFTKIVANSGLKVIVEQNQTVSVEVEADANLLNHITTKVVNGTLQIASDENIYSSDAKIVRVSMPTIDALEATSGSNLSSNTTLKGSKISVKSSSGSAMNIEVEYDTINSESSSGSNLKLSGVALQLTTAASSGSSINAEKLTVNDVSSQSSSGSTTRVKAQVSLNAKASSGSSINNSGKATKIIKEESSGGSVSSNP